jgi:CheY-like chemotaxis protein
LARKILLADDSVTAQNMGRKILADAGYEVVTVNNGSAALKKITELKPDLVILDVYMPGYSGLEVCQRMKEASECARIPVLLSVGKLEPFKPEEAQRVRAEGYIVKPFEASELLAALAKLEDKIVPRAEPSKPGRFARALASLDESSSGARGEKFPGEDSVQQNGWKSRIGFPREHAATEDKIDDYSGIYNPMNRDLRTVVRTPAETAAEKPVDSSQPPPAAGAHVDLAALVPPGLPTDVTPEEVAAIAAAMQIRMAGESLNGNSQPGAPTPAMETTAPGNEDFIISPAPDLAHGSEAFLPSVVQAQAAATEQIKQEQIKRELIENEPAKVDESPLDLEISNDGYQRAYASDAPVTMAAAEAALGADPGLGRWTAVAVALDGDQANVSLEQEMHEAYADFVRDTNSHGSERSPEPQTAASAAPVAVADEQEAPADFAAATVVEAGPVPQVESALPELSPLSPDGAPAGIEHQEVQTSLLAAVPGRVAPQGPASLPALTPMEQESQTADESEAVKSTAAAWASWRSIRDAKKDDSAAAPPSYRQFESPAAQPEETAAMAVAAGAENSVADASLPSAENSADVASIVESMLADLRPKLMAELSRKMAERK